MGLQYSTERRKINDYEKTDNEDIMISKTFITSIKKKKVSPKKKKTTPKKKKVSPKKKKTTPKKKKVSPRRKAKTTPKKKKVSPRRKMSSVSNKKKVSSTPGLTLVPDARTRAGVGHWDKKNVRLRKEKKNKK